MSELFKKDIVIRILSVASAVLLWFYVLNDVNPSITRDYRNVKVKIINEKFLEESRLTVNNKQYDITVTIEGRRRVLETLDTRDISAEMDFLDISRPGLNKVSVQRVQYNGQYKDEIKIKDWYPKNFDIEVDRIDLNSFSIDIITNGIPKQDYQIVGKRVKPNKIDLQGPEALTRKVASVRIEADVNGIDRDIILRKECKVLDKYGQEIPELMVTIPPVDVEIQVAKEVPITYTTTGNPLKGFGVSGMRLNPDKVLVAGDYKLMAELQSVQLEPINLDNLSRSLETRMQIKLPPGLSIVNGSEFTVFTAFIEQFAKEDIVLNGIKVQNVKLPNDLKYEVVTSKVTVTVAGTPVNLERMKTEEIRAGFDIEATEPGTYKFPLKLTLPDNIYLSGENYVVEVRVEKKAAVDQPAAAPSPSPASAQ